MSQLVSRGLLLLALLAAHGCAGTGGKATKSDPRPARRADVITIDEIERRQWPNVYEMIRELRGGWLADRGRDTLLGQPTEIQVHLDDMRLGSVSQLHSLPVSGITYVRFFDGIEASGRWGTGYGKGAIYLSTAAPVRAP